MEIRVNTGPSSPRENKSSVIWEFSSWIDGASIDNNLAQPYIQQKYKAFFFCSRIPFRAETLFGNRFLKVKNPPPPRIFHLSNKFRRKRKIEKRREKRRSRVVVQRCWKKKKINGRCEADIMAGLVDWNKRARSIDSHAV